MKVVIMMMMMMRMMMMMMMIIKKIQNFKKELIDQNILDRNSVKEVDNIINKWKQTKDKDIVYINNKDKVATRKFDIYQVFSEYLRKNISYEEIKSMTNNIKEAVKLSQKGRSKYSDKRSIINNSNKTIKGIELITSLIDNDKLRIPREYYAKPLNNTNLSWTKDEEGYEQIAEEAGSNYRKGNNDNELELIKDFITKINNSKTNNKDTAASEFRKLKQKVTNDRLKQDLIKDLEKYIFGNNLESIESKEDYSKENVEYLKYLEEQEKGQKRFSDNYDSSGSGLNKKGSGLKILTNKQMLNRLPILLAQIQAGNNSNKLKNETRQILYSLYRSKVLTKTVYNNLIKAI